jgi:hypothetical protein
VGNKRNGRPAVSSSGDGVDGSDDLTCTLILARVSALVDAAAVLSEDCAIAFSRAPRMRTAIATRHLYRATHHAHLAAELLAAEAEGAAS